MHRPANKLLLTAAFLACASAPETSAPPAAPDPGRALVSTGGIHRISEIDGQKVHKQRVSLDPGPRTLTFESRSGRTIGGLVPLLYAECTINSTLEAGHSYVYEGEISESLIADEGLEKMRWTARALEPRFLDVAESSEVEGLDCTSSCTAHGSKGSKSTVMPCEKYDAFVIKNGPQGSFRETVPSSQADIQRQASRLIKKECIRRREGRSCRGQLHQLRIGYNHPTAGLLLYLPKAGSNPTQVEREAARAECRSGDPAQVSRCLTSRGWEQARD